MNTVERDRNENCKQVRQSFEVLFSVNFLMLNFNV